VLGGYLCDQCATARAQGVNIIPFNQVLDRAQEAAARAEQRGNVLLIP
jgi:hypothetical protein